MNILAIGAHFDDIELGCSGSLLRHAEAGANLTMLVVSSSGYANPTGECIRSDTTARAEGELGASILGSALHTFDLPTFEISCNEDLTSRILQLIQELDIDTLYTHWMDDIHRDHRNVAQASLMASKLVPRVLSYRSNFYDSGVAFDGHFYTDVTNVFETKLKAVQAHKSELARVGNSWCEILEKDAMLNGLAVGVRYAERLKAIRYLAP